MAECDVERHVPAAGNLTRSSHGSRTRADRPSPTHLVGGEQSRALSAGSSQTAIVWAMRIPSAVDLVGGGPLAVVVGERHASRGTSDRLRSTATPFHALTRCIAV